MLGPNAVLVEIWRKPMQGSKSADEFALLHADFECDPPTPLTGDTDLMPLVEVQEQQYQCWTEEAREVRRGDKIIWDVTENDTREYLLKDVTDPFDIPVGQTSRRLHLVRIKK